MSGVENAIITIVSMSVYNIVMFVLCPFRQKGWHMALVELIGVIVPMGIQQLGREFQLGIASTYAVCMSC